MFAISSFAAQVVLAAKLSPQLTKRRPNLRFSCEDDLTPRHLKVEL